jgi:V-type H+-transporting ATPase subunit a
MLKNEPSSDGHHNIPFADIFIHQLIETIEFVLGTISNTASYLRLWALSLAHGQLAAVFLENTILPALELHSFGATVIGVWIGYFMWVSFTIGVLMSMDVMECFLHTLRLHWVEFQNKFYKG